MRVIAIDGPAGSGKSTVAKAVAARLGFAYLDTGAMYRVVTAAVLRAGIDPAVETSAGAVAELARSCRFELDGATVVLDGVDVTAEIRGPAVTAAVSAVAANGEVRTELVRRQRAWIAERAGAVLEGRDIGTVVVPDAPLKVYLTASEAARAARRAGEGTVGADRDAVAADLARRDRLDSTRAVAPLSAAADAVVVDTSDLGIDEVVTAVLELWAERVGPAPGPAAGGAEPVRPVRPDTPDRLDRAWNGAAPDRWARVLYAAARSLVVGLCYVVFRVEVRGRSNIPTTGPVILAPVHRSNLDTPIAACATRRPLRFMGKDSLWGSNRAFASLLSALGAFPVARGTADRDALRRCQVVLEAGQPLVLYPEGTRQTGPVLALRTGAPIVPIGIGGSERAQAKGSTLIRPTKVRVVVGAPLHPPAGREGRATSRRAVRELTAELAVQLQAVFDEARTGLRP
jgi:cytidylate kinase